MSQPDDRNPVEARYSSAFLFFRAPRFSLLANDAGGSSRFNVSPNSVSISSTVGKTDCRPDGSARVSSYVQIPKGLSIPAKLYSASNRSCSWQRIKSYPKTVAEKGTGTFCSEDSAK